MQKVVIYARYSSDNQREESIEGQIRVCTEYAERHDMSVIEVYADRAMTGRNTNRPEFQRMMADSKKGVFKHVLVWKGDRISRDRYDKADCRVKLKKAGVTIISVTEAIPDGPEGILLEALLDGMAEYYSANLAENTLRGMTENALKCKYNGSVVPYGYKITKDKNYQIESQEAQEAVQEIYSRYSNGDSMKSILDYLRGHQIRRNKDSYFNYNTLRNLIRNPIYKGTYTFADVAIEDGVPAMVSKDLWDTANKRAKQSSRKAARPGMSTVRFYLTGHLTCGLCGAPITGVSGTGRGNKTYYYYSCVKHKKDSSCDLPNYPKDELEKRIAIAIESVINDDAIIEEIATAYMKAQERWFEDDIKIQSREEIRAKELRKEIKNLSDAIAMGSVAQTIIDKLNAAQVELDSLEVSLAKSKIKQPHLLKSEILYWLHAQKKAIIENDNERESLNSALLNHAYVYPDKLVIAMNFTPQDELKENQEDDPEMKKATFLVEDGLDELKTVRLSSDWLPLLDSNRRPFG